MTDGSDGGNPDPSPPGEEGVLDPDDLDIRTRDGVAEQGEGRYVISIEGGAAADDPEDDDQPHLDALADELEDLSAPYGLALAGNADGDAASIQFAGGDPADVLGAAVRWYARQVDPDDPDATAAALLSAAGLSPESD